jgi:hypothetical protein
MGIFKKLSKQTKAPKPPGAARTDPKRPPMPPKTKEEKCLNLELN